ncbi:protein mono-ADP-ribosyltransferase PARP14-like [Octopus sinensis]|uniref:Poly [ADP-ribose] polymerase n=1 Tax=Octopus sinensis TaxID=2607531 RepID=A0A7E6FAK4_9MOLL|nr:protein mono-ADP-ribosyltransferase PARP14-like [Octopus sinensis]
MCALPISRAKIPVEIMAEKGISASNKGGDDEGRTILVSGVPTEFRLEAIQSYFENKSRSSGGPIKGIPERIQDSGKVIITFESEKDAENVKKKVHYVNKHILHVYWYKNLVWQEDAMIVSNGPKDMSKEMLIDFFEENWKLEIVDVFPGRNPGTFLVYCQSEIDFGNVQKLCQNNPLKGNQLKVDRIKEINSVQVENVSSNVSSERLQSYFGNRKKSSGGDISSVQQQTSDTYIVSFKEACVVLDVCRRRHQLEGMKVNVQPFWVPCEENTISSQQVHDYLLPSQFHLTFLQKHQLVFDSKLKELAEVIWKDSKSNKLKLKYSEENFEEIEKCLEDLLNSITVEIIYVPDEIFEDIVRTFKSEDDKKYFYFDFRYHKVHILGFDKSSVIKMKKRLLDNLRTEREDELNIHERCILSGLEFFADAERQFEGLKVTAESNKVIFEGQYSKVTNCQKNMYEILRSIVKSELCLPLNTGMIINKKSVKEYLDEKLRNKKCIGSWETGDGDSVILYASDKTHLSLLEEIMKETFVANTLDFVDKIKDTPIHGMWLTYFESLKEEFPDFCFFGEDSIVAVDAVVNDIKTKIDNFKQSLIYESYISMPLEHFLFLKEFKEQEINDFSGKHKIKNVCLKDNKLHLEGTQNQIRKMETFIENLRKDISSKEENFEMFGFQEFLENEEGKNFLCKMQKQSESIILNSDLGSETDEIVNFILENMGEGAAAIVQKETTSSNPSPLHPQQKVPSMIPRTNVTSRENAGIKINLMPDSISNASVDVIVNSTNKNLQLNDGSISKFILNAAGPQIQSECSQKYPQGISTSNIAITKGYNLKCKNVFHLVLPSWDENSSDSILANLTQIITICLETAEKMGAKSLAFPILGAGTLKYPIENLPRTMYEAVKNYSIQNSSQIKDVYFVVYPQDTEILKKFDEYFQGNTTGSSTASSGTSPLHPQQKAASVTPRTNVALTKNPGIKINLMTDSISNVSVDVIVNSSNEELQLDKGSISKFILNAAGPQIQNECNQRYPQGISTSKIAVTKGYNLNCKNVFHLVLPPWDVNSPDSILANLTQIITTCLKKAEELGAKSLAFPILGAGTLKYPIEILPRTMYEAVKNYSNQNSSWIKDVYFVVYPQDTEIMKKFDEYLLNKPVNEGVHSKDTVSSNASLPGSQQESSSMTPRTNVTSRENAGIKINLWIDSISNASVDVIVNSSNRHLQLDKGSISKFILFAAGLQMQDECNQRYPQGISASEIAITKGYNLNCKNVFHLALHEWDEYYSHSILANLTQIITTCLKKAEELGAKSLAFPILGAGTLKYPIEILPRIMYEAVKNYSNQNSSRIKDVYFVVYPQDTEIMKKFDEYLLNKPVNEGVHSKDTVSSNASLPGSQQESSSMTPRTNVTSRENAGIKINLWIDSISNASVDVIVNSTNKNLQLNDGSISKFILNAAGPQIQSECSQKYPQGISTSNIAITKGYNLKCKNVFHLALPPWDEYPPDSILANLTQIITICLETAERMGAKSLAFPILGAGKLRYPIEQLPGIMYEAVKNYSNQNSSQIKVVDFVVYPQDTEIVKKFYEYLQNRQKNERLLPRDTDICLFSATPSPNPSLPDPRQKAPTMTPRTNVTSRENAGIKIQLLIDSISNASVDVIVNSTNEHLQLDSGAISKFILHNAGPEIQDECSQRYPQGISMSEIAVTKGYNLKCDNVFHLALPAWDENSSHSILANLTQIITICLEKAEELGAKSLAFPILGAGILKYPIENLPRTMYEAVKNYSNQNSSRIKDVYFVVYPQDTEIVKKFKEYFQQMPADGSYGSHVSSDDEDIDDEDDEDEEIEDNVSAGQKVVGVTLKFFAKYQNLDNAIETVKKEYDSLLTTQEIPFDVDLTESRKLRLRDISRTDKIQISVSDTITIYGRQPHVKDAKLSVQSLLMEFKETDEETLIKEMVQWSYFEESFPENLRMFSDKENAKLEKAYTLKKKFINWKKIKYNFQKMSFRLGGREFKMKRKQNIKEELIPDTWSPMGDEELFKIVPVTNGPEYDDIQATFRQNLPSYRIIKIERIQNKTLYQGYQALKRKFEVENPNISNEVDGLWHGTAEGAVEGINKSGFNRSYCGRNATAFGEGVYFAKDIKYSASDTYSTPDHHRIKRIYQCSVLVGKVIQGQHRLKVLQESYNSAVNNIQTPSIYIIFHDSQAYPNYLITFSNQ